MCLSSGGSKPSRHVGEVGLFLLSIADLPTNISKHGLHLQQGNFRDCCSSRLCMGNRQESIIIQYRSATFSKGNGGP